MNRTRRGKNTCQCYILCEYRTSTRKATSLAPVSIPEPAPGCQSGLCTHRFHFTMSLTCWSLALPLHGGAPHLPEQCFVTTPLNKKLLWSTLQRHWGLYELRHLPYGKLGWSWYPQGPKVHQSPHQSALPTKSLPVPIKIQLAPQFKFLPAVK